MSPTEATFRHQQQQQQNSSIYPAPQVPYSDNPQGHQRISSLSSQGMHDEVGGVQRGQVGAGYGPYAVSAPRLGCCSLSINRGTLQNKELMISMIMLGSRSTRSLQAHRINLNTPRPDPVRPGSPARNRPPRSIA